MWLFLWFRNARVCMKKISITLISFIFISNAWGGLFGASNYDECMLEKMKGQTNSMRSSAENACEIAFPTERLLETNIWAVDSVDISFVYKPTTNELIDIDVTNNSNYKVTKIKGQTRSSCQKDSTVLDRFEKTTPLISSTYTIKVKDTRKVNCIELFFYGKRYK